MDIVEPQSQTATTAQLIARLEKISPEDAAELRDFQDILRLIARIKEQKAEIGRLRAAIRKHRDQRMDNRCWLDDVELYRELGEEIPASYELKLPPKEEFLESCRRYWEQRQPGESGIAARTGGPECMTIHQLQSEIERLKATLAKLGTAEIDRLRALHDKSAAAGSTPDSQSTRSTG